LPPRRWIELVKTIETTLAGRFEVAWGLDEPSALLNTLEAGSRDRPPASVRLADPRHKGEVKELQVYLDAGTGKPFLVGEITPGIWAVGWLLDEATP
jgi:hypothetical protein